MREVCWEKMFPDQLEAAFAECPLVYFPYGICEPHGPQCALGLDGLKVHGIAIAAAREHGGIVAPMEWWHIHELSGYACWSEKSVGEVPRTWLTTMPPWMHFKHICYHIRTAEVHGFHAAILLTGHYGPNYVDLQTMVDLIQPHVGTRLYALPDFEANQPGFDCDGHSGGDHAGKVETSLLWAINPECVDMSRVPPVGTPGEHLAMGANVRESNRLTGERMVADEVAFLGARAHDLLAAYDDAKPAHTLRTFEDVEVLWESVIRPHLKEFRTMQPLWEGQEPVSPDSVWYENWPVPDRG
jgi:creatinine amidohydrolase